MAAGVVARGEILRAVHTCQVIGLHRAAAAGLRVAEGLARLQADDPEFRLVELRKDVAEALRVARRISRGDASTEVIGVARRAYEAVGGLRLFGLFTEPIIARSGYAGVVTYFVDRDQRIWALSDVLPADADRAVDAYANGAALGDVALSHRAASRAGLHIGDARASRDGRLGRGQQVRAVGAEGAAWTEPPIDDLFRVPLADQLARIWRSSELLGDRSTSGRVIPFRDGHGRRTARRPARRRDRWDRVHVCRSRRPPGAVLPRQPDGPRRRRGDTPADHRQAASRIDPERWSCWPSARTRVGD